MWFYNYESNHKVKSLYGYFSDFCRPLVFHRRAKKFEKKPNNKKTESVNSFII